MSASTAIRPETALDYRAIFDLNVSAFGREKEAKLVEDLRRSGAFVPELSLVAQQDGKIVGYILFTKIEFVEHREHRGLAIGPVAVAPTMQKQGIGSLLIREGLKRANELGFDSVLLLGSPAYYPRFGFKLASEWNITTAYNAPGETFALELHDHALQGISGVAQYAKEFALNDC
ncbi:MAG TPA: N-acetyltransferase [Candidatus Paceibacterota bacterium]|nr:N-acetyltransferase [Candidatus Paceibacterota bacterium]